MSCTITDTMGSDRMTKQKLKDYRYTCKCIKQLEAELNDAAVTDSTQGSQSEYPYVKHSVTISGVPDTDTHLAKKKRLSELKVQKAEVERFIDDIPDEQTRDMFKLRYIKGYKLSKTAVEIGGDNTPDGVRMRINRYLG
nr:MAG TPA: Protein of unknown function (DUF722) [Caudoviricetes sp.]